jgi:sorting nexin-1/2
VVNVDTNKMSMKGNKDEKFVEERRALLERFLREIAQYDYLIESKEFKVFARGTGEVTSELEKMPPQSPIQILEKYRLNFKIDEDQANSETARYKDKINIFQTFLRKAIVSLEKQKKEFKEYAAAQDDSYGHYQRVYAAFIKFEETAVDYYADGDRALRIMTHPSAAELSTNIDETIKSWKNPFREAWLWIKGELLDVRGMMDAMNGRDAVIQKQLKTEQKIRDKQKELDKMTLGKTTLKSFFKTKSGVEKDILNYQADIEAMNVDVEDYRKLINFITIYHGQLAIDKFKKAKLLQYQKMLNFFAVREIGNAHVSATLYHSILELNEQK